MSNRRRYSSRAFKPYSELRFTDDFMFRKLLTDDEDLCRRLVELLLDVKVRKIEYKDDNHEIAVTPDKKGVRLDVYLEDDDGTVFDLEMQNMLKKDMPRRARYYQSMIDVNHLDAGAAYYELPDSYIVFICTSDPFGAEMHKYEFRELCINRQDIVLDSGTVKVFINARGRKEDASEDMRAFLDYLCGEQASSELTRDIELGISRAKGRKPWEVEYMTLREIYSAEIMDIQREAREEAREEVREEVREEMAFEAVDALVAGDIMDVREACELLGVSLEAYQKHIS